MDRVYAYETTQDTGGRTSFGGVRVSFSRGLKTVVTDSHFLVPFFVLLAGIALLVVLH